MNEKQLRRAIEVLLESQPDNQRLRDNLEGLSRDPLLPALTWVVRDGREFEVPREQVVPGDLLLLDEGQQVPADARLIKVVALRVDLSALTGESAAKLRTRSE